MYPEERNSPEYYRDVSDVSLLIYKVYNLLLSRRKEPFLTRKNKKVFLSAIRVPSKTIITPIRVTAL